MRARLAWMGLGKYRGLGERLTVLLEQLVYPALAQALDVRPGGSQARAAAARRCTGTRT